MLIFLIQFKINNASKVYYLKFNDVDNYTPAIISVIKRVNDMIPELDKTLNDDGHQYYLVGEGVFLEQATSEVDKPFSVVKYSDKEKRVMPCPHLASSRVANRINAVIKELNLLNTAS